MVVLPLAGVPDVGVPDEEDSRLRTAMDQHLLELCDDDELLGALARVVELVGSPEERLASLTAVDTANRPEGGATWGSQADFSAAIDAPVAGLVAQNTALPA